MKLAAFNALTTVAYSGISALPVGTYFLLDTPSTDPPGNPGESKQQGNTSLRHKITYHQRITSDGSLAGMHSVIYRRVFDILESDDLGQSTKSAVKPKINTAPERDDNDRNFIKEGDWS